MNTIICYHLKVCKYVIFIESFNSSNNLRAQRKSNLIGWQQTLTPPSPNHIRVLLFSAKKSATLRVNWRMALFGGHDIGLDGSTGCFGKLEKVSING
jgi:hypothetical protein